MIVRYDSSVLKKCMKPAGNFLCVRGVKGMYGTIENKL